MWEVDNCLRPSAIEYGVIVERFVVRYQRESIERCKECKVLS
jgi:hypothetical protein